MHTLVGWNPSAKIEQRFRQKDSRVVWMIPALFCLWVNTHGSWLIGLILFSIITAAGFARGSWGAVSAEPWTASQRKKLLLVWVASVAALFVNPFGSRLVFYPFDLAFRQKLNIEHVAEWISVNFHDLRGKLVLVLLLVLVISALLRSCRWTLAELGLLAFALYSGLTYSRFLFLLGIPIPYLLLSAFFLSSCLVALLPKKRLLQFGRRRLAPHAARRGL